MSLISEALKEAQKKRDNLREKELLDLRTAEVKRRGKSFLVKGIIVVAFLILLSLLPLFILQKKISSKNPKMIGKVNKSVRIIKEDRKKSDVFENKAIGAKKQPIVIAKKQQPEKTLTIKEKKSEKKVKAQIEGKKIKKKTEERKKELNNDNNGELSDKKEVSTNNKKEILEVGKVEKKIEKVKIIKKDKIKEADLLIKKGEYKKAELILKDILSKNPMDLKAIFDLGTLYLLKGEYYTAYSYYERALKIAPTDEKLLFNTGVSLFKMGKIAEAKLVWQRLYSLNKNFPELYYFLGVSEDLTKNYDKAKYYYKEYLKSGENTELKRWVIKRLSQL